MALLYMDGFDMQDCDLRWATIGSNTAAVEYAAGRLGTGFCLGLTSGSGVQTRQRSFTASAKVIVGLGVKRNNTADDGDFLILKGDAGATSHLSLRARSGNQLQLTRGGTVIATASGVDLSVFHYIEVSATVADSGGRAIVKVDGITVIDFTGDTKNGGTNTTLDALALSQPVIGGSIRYWFDDVYICSGVDSGIAGMPNNDFLGDRQVVTLRPSGAGSSTQLAPTGSATNWQNVDETPFDAADYNASAVVGQRDTYALGDLPSGSGVVHGIQNCMIAQKSDAGNANMKTAVKSGAGVYYGPVVGLATSPAWSGTIRESDPATSAAWTAAGVNALEAGAEVA
ncbi:hypothetical protein [Phycicoccus sp. 3266]|uniref:hypothetical protein n=1 Tax=Phycicoccus sp. 3266 TaxID=2817751 RepID=UPI0028569BE5|nr:hypothetical protein [Phycicoccus sp. 3266]MDR6861983.1 hypothetical protein [Phycicoccus sp. 3266]